MRMLTMITGLIMLVFGSLFMLQGLDIVHWPANSFMLGARQWIVYGAAIAAAGAFLMLFSRRGLRR